MLLVQDGIVFADGRTDNIELQSLYFSLVTILTVSVKMLLFTNFLTNLMVLALFASIASWAVMFLTTSGKNNQLDYFSQMLTSSFYLGCLVLIPTLVNLRDFAWRFYTRQFRPRPYHIVQEMSAIELQSKSSDKIFERSRQFRPSTGFSFAQTTGEGSKMAAYGACKDIKNKTLS